MSTISIEVVAYNLHSVAAAIRAGADRVELCASPDEGGTTPAYGIIAQARKLCPLDLYVMIRPRGGDFLYSSYEYNAMMQDIGQCQRLSVDGLVFGILLENGSIDIERCKALIEKAKPLKTTCHRAFDMTRDPFQALEDCIAVGFDRILTSGQMQSVEDGSELIAKLIRQADGRIKIMPGSGINDKNATRIIEATGAKEVHLSAGTFINSGMIYLNQEIQSMGNATASEYKIRSVNEEMIRNIRESLKK
jgi:copper homeostasis protein